MRRKVDYFKLIIDDCMVEILQLISKARKLA